MMARQQQGWMFLKVLCLVLLLSFVTYEISGIDAPSALGSPAIGLTVVSVIGAIACSYVFSVGSRAFSSTKSLRVLFLSLSSLAIALFAAEIAIIGFMYRSAAVNSVVQLLDITAIFAAVLLIASLAAGSRVGSRRAFKQAVLGVVVLWAVVSFVLPLLPDFYAEGRPLPPHRLLLAIASSLVLAAAVLYERVYWRRKSTLVMWYVAAFVFFGIGLFNIASMRQFGDISSWFGVLCILAGYLLLVMPLLFPEKEQG